MDKVVISARVDPELLKRVDAVAKRTGESRSECVERALRVGLEDTAAAVERMEGFGGVCMDFIARSDSLFDWLRRESGMTEAEGRAMRDRIRTIRKTRKG